MKGAKELRLVVNSGGDGIGYDHADWADAQLLKTGGTPTPTPTPTPDSDAHAHGPRQPGSR